MTREAFLDSSLVTVKELPVAMLVSRTTVFNWRAQGYVFEFGRLTTLGHCKAWLRARAEKVGNRTRG
jgi:hypothetical protein